MIKIYTLNWLSKEILEAEVYWTDGSFNIVCFSQPFNRSVEINVNSPLHTLNAGDIFKLINKEGMLVEKAVFLIIN